jgi:hypothetical protein
MYVQNPQKINNFPIKITISKSVSFLFMNPNKTKSHMIWPRIESGSPWWKVDEKVKAWLKVDSITIFEHL